MENDKPSKIPAVIIFILLLGSIYYFATIAIERNSQPTKSTLTIGVNTPFPPFEYEQGNNVVGFDIELAQKISDKLNRNVNITNFQDFQTIFTSVENGNIDMGISGITITPERDSIVDFSESYFNTSQAFLTSRNNNIKFVSNNITPSDFKGLRVGYQELTTSQSWAETNLGGIVKSNTSYSDITIAIQSIRLGAIDGIILDESVADNLVKTYPDLTISGVVKTDEKYGIIVKEGDPQKLLPVVNSVLEEMKKNGEYDKLIQKYFGGN